MMTFTLTGRMELGGVGFVIRTGLRYADIPQVLTRYSKTWRYLTLELEKIA